MPTSVKAFRCFYKEPGRQVGEWGGGGHCLTFASCFVRKSTKPKPRCEPVPLIFFGKRTVFSSPKVLETEGKAQES